MAMLNNQMVTKKSKKTIMITILGWLNQLSHTIVDGSIPINPEITIFWNTNLVVGLEHFVFFHSVGNSIFQRGRSTTNQIINNNH